MSRTTFFDTGGGAKYKLIYDRTSVGDSRLLDEESYHGYGIETILFFLATILLLALTTGFGAYMTFNLDSDKSMSVFLLWFCGMFFDAVLYRNILILFQATVIKCCWKNKYFNQILNLAGENAALVHDKLREVLLEQVNLSNEVERSFYQTKAGPSENVLD